MGDETAANYVRDLGNLVKELAQAARARARDTGDAFDSGRAMGLYEVVSLMTQQADVFEMSRESIGLSDIDPDRDLL